MRAATMVESAFTPKITLTTALTDPNLFGKTFSPQSFWTWRTLGKVIDGIPLTEQREINLFRQCTGRTQLLSTTSSNVLRRVIVLVGRRGGKDRFLSGVGVWRAALCADWRQYLSAGEQAVVILLGRDKKQASILRRYCRGLLQVEALQREVKRETNDVIEFRNGATLEISSNDASLVRGRSAIAVLGSECCHWKHDESSASSDEEVVGAAEPSMAMCPDGGLLLLGSSVHRQRGYMYRKHRALFGNDGSDDICWFAPSKIMNPRLPQAVIDAALSEDPHRGAAEFGNRWREDLTDIFPLDAVEAVTDWDTYERPPEQHTYYRAYFDAATGTGSDSFTLAIGHRLHDDAGTVVVDCVRERKPRFVPSDVIAEYCLLLKAYGISEVSGDPFAGGYQDEWARNGVLFKPAEYTTSENYLRALPIILSKRTRLVNSATLRNQLTSLERSVTAGREKVDHPKHANAHDDVAASVAGLLVLAGNRLLFDAGYSWVDGTPIMAEAALAAETEQQKRQRESESWHQFRLHQYMRANGIWI
jgi:hypothetical protein